MLFISVLKVLYKFRLVLGQTFLKLSNIVLSVQFVYIIMGFRNKSVYKLSKSSSSSSSISSSSNSSSSSSSMVKGTIAAVAVFAYARTASN
jgi:hypothetical protein